MILNKTQTRKRNGIGKEKQVKQSESEKQENIAKKAFELFEKRGHVPGHDLEDWFEAEKNIKKNKEWR